MRDCVIIGKKYKVYMGLGLETSGRVMVVSFPRCDKTRKCNRLITKKVFLTSSHLFIVHSNGSADALIDDGTSPASKTSFLCHLL